MGKLKIDRYQHTFTMGNGETGKIHDDRLNALCKTMGKKKDEVLKEALVVLENKVRGLRSAK